MHMGPAASAEAVLSRIWPDAVAIEDRERAIYAALGIGRMSVCEVLRLRFWRQSFRAMRKGFRQGKPAGASVMQMPGAALVERGQVVWQHAFDGPGDLPDWGTLPMSGGERKEVGGIR